MHRWVKALNIKMGIQKWYICLLVDNFSGHKISFAPWNIQIIFFEPNLTSFVQPLDAFKAHYCRQFCLRAIDLDEAGNSNIWKISLHEAMMMAIRAWIAVTSTTIQHCWNHMGRNVSSTSLPAKQQNSKWQNGKSWQKYLALSYALLLSGTNICPTTTIYPWYSMLYSLGQLTC